METSKKGVTFIARHEGFRDSVYKDVAGLPTIGYGHLIKPGEEYTTITHEEAIALLHEDLRIAEQAVESAVKVPLRQCEFDALVSFTFNLGSGALRASTLLKKLNDSDYEGASNEFKRWDKARVNGELVSVKGLRLRRIEEALLFRFGEYE